MKFPVHSKVDTNRRQSLILFIGADNRQIPLGEIVRRANAFDELLKALRAANDCLDYCGWGDSWERECADSNGQTKLIQDTVAKYIKDKE